MKLTSGDLAKLIQGELIGDSTILLTGPSKIEEGGAGTVSFLGNMKYEPYFYNCTASVIIIDRNFIPKKDYSATIIKVDDVYQTMSLLLAQFQQTVNASGGIDTSAIVNPKATVSSDASIGPMTVIEEGASISANVHIISQAYIGRNVHIGKGTVINPGVRIYHDSVIGENCIIHSNVVIGSDGFGFAPDGQGNFQKVPQLGNVIIEDNVEIGSNTCIDRATIGSTFIGKGTKLDNLIQIAHNVKIGQNTVIAAQTGIAGSTKIGNYCMIGGQVGIAGHLEIADGTKIQAQSGIGANIKDENSKWYGSPAIDYFTYLRAYSEFKKLPELSKKLNQLEQEFKKTINSREK
ncbi:MAG: UDP-3-O-(3-hydroxymyristoyl)glucosamine N-acyltransferase [Saprospiraceae bacterium]|nr:UDP-3-O-(3-hydroxymyristoyl)glucosamine N-acyltransferase [Saprospiraceae bacterium]